MIHRTLIAALLSTLLLASNNNVICVEKVTFFDTCMAFALFLPSTYFTCFGLRSTCRGLSQRCLMLSTAGLPITLLGVTGISTGYSILTEN